MIRKKYTEPTWNDDTHIVTITQKLPLHSTLSEDEMSNVDTAKRKAPLTEKTKFIYAGKTEN